MNRKIKAAAALIFLTACLAHAKGDKMKNTPVWTDDAHTFLFHSHHGGRVDDVSFDLNSKRIMNNVSDSGWTPNKRSSTKILSEAEVQGLLKVLKSLSLSEDTAKHGPPPGGSSHFKIVYGKGQERVLATKEGITRDTTHFVLSDDQDQALFQALKAVTPPVREEKDCSESPAADDKCDDTSASEEKEGKSFPISKGYTRLAKLTFTTSLRPSLELLGNEADHKELQKVYEEIIARPTLHLDVEHREGGNRSYDSMVVNPGDSNYPWAVAEELRAKGYSWER